MKNLITDINKNLGEKLMDAHFITHDEESFSDNDTLSLTQYTEVLSSLMFKQGINHVLDSDLVV
jgi:hypothetical protein